jgi:hypothetical protein
MRKSVQESSREGGLAMQPQTVKKPDENKQVNTESDSLKGTFASVLMLGAFIVICWFAAFALFLNRA